jgi:hypothetical protein
MKQFLIILTILNLCLTSFGQSISQLGIWNNNANFVIKHYQDKVITSTTSGIQFIDVSNPSFPHPTASIGNPSNFPMAIEIEGNYAYFGGGMTGYFMIADISNINFPVQVGITTDVYGTAYQIAVSGNYAYMATNSDTLYSIDISNKTAPIIVGKIDIGSFPGGITVQGNIVYVGTTNGLKVVNISNPSNPVILTSFGSGYSKIAADFANQRLFVAKGSGFDAISIANPTSPSGIFMGIGGGSCGDICYWNNYVFQNGASNVSAFQVNSTSANYLGSFNSTFTGQVNGISVKDSVFYVSTVNSLHVLNLGYAITSGINEGISDNFNIYPNPFLNEMTIEFINTFNDSKITITDLSGREIKKTFSHGNSTTLDMADELSGVYLINVEQGNLKTQKIIIKE